MNDSNQLLIFALDTQRYALILAAVEQVIRLVEITPLPEALSTVMGVINVRGEVIPVISMRRRFRLPKKETSLSDQLIIAQTPRRKVALLIDAATGVVEHSEGPLITAGEILPEIGAVQGVVKLKDEIILIHDLDKCLSLEEEKILDEAMQRA